jgi:SRSO17 transposase
LAEPLEPDWRRWLLVRRRVSSPQALQAEVVFAPQATPLEEVVRVAGTRWTIEQRFEAAKGDVGLDHDEVRSWTGWYRHMTLALWALSRLTVLRTGAIAVEALKKAGRPPGGKPFGGVQGQPRPHIPLSGPEIRRLLWRMVLGAQQTGHHIWAWSQWRRWHQGLATHYHDKHRGALAEL